MSFTKKDLVYSVVTGLIAGVLGWFVLASIGVRSLFGVPLVALIVIVPVAWIAGVNLGYLLGRRLSFFNEFGKFVAIGFTNATVDFGILNLLIVTTGKTAGFAYILFKGVSFIGAMTHSYFWNKVWVFQSSDSHGGAAEFGKFFIVAVTAGLINVLVASGIVGLVDPLFGLNATQWANIGAVAGSAVALISSFLGFRLVVFKKK